LVELGRRRRHHLDPVGVLARPRCGALGHSFLGHFLLSLLFVFSLSLLVAYVVERRPETRRRRPTRSPVELGENQRRSIAMLPASSPALNGTKLSYY
jgi:hypothetical protein